MTPPISHPHSSVQACNSGLGKAQGSLQRGPCFGETLPPHGCIFSLPPRRYKDGKLIPKQSQSSMQIKDVAEHHAGTYTLVLRNRLVGLEKHISLQLIVNGKGGAGARGRALSPQPQPLGCSETEFLVLS